MKNKATFEQKGRPILQEKGKRIEKLLTLTFFGVLGLISLVMAVTEVITTFDDQDNPFNVTIDYNYEPILKNDNISYFDDSTCGYVSHGCKWWNYTLNTAAAQSGLIELETNFSLAADCIQNPLQIMVGQSIAGIGPTTTQYLYCVNSTDNLVSLGSTQTSSQDFVIYLNTLYKREYLTVPLYAYVQNVTLNITGRVLS